MTKQQISVRVSPDILAAIDAAAKRQGVSRGHIVDRWLAAQAAAKPAPLIRLGMLIEQARTDTGAGELASALHIVCDVLDVLAGTAPEE